VPIAKNLCKKFFEKLHPLPIISFESEQPIAYERSILIRLICIEFRKGGINGGKRCTNADQAWDMIPEYVHTFARFTTRQVPMLAPH